MRILNAFLRPLHVYTSTCITNSRPDYETKSTDLKSESWRIINAGIGAKSPQYLRDTVHANSMCIYVYQNGPTVVLSAAQSPINESGNEHRGQSHPHSVCTARLAAISAITYV